MPGYPGAPGAAPAGPAAIPAGATVGRVVQAFRGEDGKLTLYLSKSSGPKIKVGMQGSVLVGADGGQVLEGASFTVSKVLGDGQAVAVSEFNKPLGKNTRFMIVKK